MADITVSADIHSFMQAANAAAARTVLGAGTSSAVGSNPATSIGLAAVNGVATTFMRSDGAPALDVSIAPTWTGVHAFSQNALGTTTAFSNRLINSTAASLGAQQVSPSTRWTGQGWATGVDNSQAVDFQAFVLPVQAATNPTATWKLQSSINGAAFADRLTSSTVDGLAVTSTNTSSGLALTLTSGLGSGTFSIVGGNHLTYSAGITANWLAVGSTSYFIIGAETISYREAAGHWTHRNSTTAQILSVSNTWTSTTNFERFKIDWATTANTCRIGTSKGSGGGSACALTIEVGDTAVINLGTAGEIGLYGVTAVARATTGIDEVAFVENAGGTAVNNYSTFAGYTLQQIVQALQSIGLIS